MGLLAHACLQDVALGCAVLESFLREENFHWYGDRFQPPLEFRSGVPDIDFLRATQGRYSLAQAVSPHRAVLIRDKLGINKLFFAVHEAPKLLVANRLVDLLRRGVPPEAVYSVPAGHVLEIEPRCATVRLTPYFQVTRQHASIPQEDVAANVRRGLELWFSRLAETIGDRRICVCLSGGVDSSLIAAFARRYFDDVTAYTYGYVDNGQLTEDACYGARVSDSIGARFRFVPATRQQILSVVDEAICYGQDWRDFNVHCAIVNEILAHAIEQDWRESGDMAAPLVLTGDFMNEFLADYSSVICQGKEYYRLPRVRTSDLRVALVRGLDAGDREVGIFSHHGIDVIQPYGLIVDELLQLPDAALENPRCKQDLVERVAGDLVPAFVFERVKTRAQVGGSSEPTGIIPVLAECGYESSWLEKRFCQLFGVADGSLLRRFVRLGRYRFSNEFPGGGYRINGYYAG